mmetsp:Transcript_21323/g.52653  ORF Transcript_21323/g.52653 Transcript_21323/m.52653 type:complete len:203 (-) Transcript_21323:323-931(-)
MHGGVVRGGGQVVREHCVAQCRGARLVHDELRRRRAPRAQCVGRGKRQLGQIHRGGAGLLRCGGGRVGQRRWRARRRTPNPALNPRLHRECRVGQGQAPLPPRRGRVAVVKHHGSVSVQAQRPPRAVEHAPRIAYRYAAGAHGDLVCAARLGRVRRLVQAVPDVRHGDVHIGGGPAGGHGEHERAPRQHGAPACVLGGSAHG